MDHELKQRLIGAVVVTALCAIFIPMLFDDPVDNSGQVVSEVSIPNPVAATDNIGQSVPADAGQVLKLPDSESLAAEPAGDIIESTGAAEEVEEEPEASASKQGNLYAESEGYANTDETVQPKNNQSKPHQQASAEQHLPAEAPTQTPGLRPVDQAIKNTVPKDSHAEPAIKEAAKFKKPAEIIPVKKPENGLPVVAKNSGIKASPLEPIVKQPSAAKNLAAAVAEAKKPDVATKASPRLVRWYIQLGSFSKKENAMSLWDSLREQGVPASLDTIEIDKATVYRLRVGPELDAKKAAAMKSKLDKQNIKGILLSE
jgi:DedD protein